MFTGVALASVALVLWSGCGSSGGGTGDFDAGLDGGPTYLPPADCAGACSGGQVCQGGQCVCPPYTTSCGGSCLPTAADPKNCGACGKTCGAAEACVAGACVTTCPEGMALCSGACVDPNTDNASCGGCGKPCPEGQGCNWGTCGAVKVATSGACAGGGPAPTSSIAGRTVRLAELGRSSFLRTAVCSCGGLSGAATFAAVDAFESAKGPYVEPGSSGGNVGVMGTFNFNNPVTIGGDLAVASSILSTRGLTVGGTFRANERLSVSGPVNVGGDAYAVDDLSSSDVFAIKGALHQPPSMKNGSGVSYASLVAESVAVVPPCPCAANDLVPIAQLVADHATANDDAAAGINPEMLKGSSGPTRLDLPCGSFYLTGIEQNGPVVIYAHGRTALYIKGRVGSRQIALAVDPGGELDVFVDGDLDLSAESFVVGNGVAPAVTRLFVSGSVSINNSVRVFGYLYALGRVSVNDTVTVYGGLFAGDYSGRDLAVHYDRTLVP